MKQSDYLVELEKRKKNPRETRTILVQHIGSEKFPQKVDQDGDPFHDFISLQMWRTYQKDFSEQWRQVEPMPVDTKKVEPKRGRKKVD